MPAQAILTLTLTLQEEAQKHEECEKAEQKVLSTSREIADEVFKKVTRTDHKKEKILHVREATTYLPGCVDQEGFARLLRDTRIEDLRKNLLFAAENSAERILVNKADRDATQERLKMLQHMLKALS